MYRLSGAKGILLLVFAVLLAALVLLSWFYNETIKAKQEQEAYNDRTEGSLSSLIDEKNSLEQEIADCQYLLDYGSIGPVVVLFAEPDARLMESAIDTVNHMDTTAVIAVSDKYFPGNKDCMSVDQVNQCLNNGWELALNCTSSTDVGALKERVKKAGLGEATCVYYSDTAGSSETSHGGGAGTTRVLKYGIETDGFMTKGISDGSYEVTRKETQAKGNCMVTVIGYNDERYKVDDVSILLANLNRNAAANHYEVLSLAGAATKVSENHKFKKENDKKLKNKIKQCQKELKEVEKQIREMKDEYDAE